MNRTKLTDLLVQSLEHERGGVELYRAALKCAVNEDLRKEWEEYLSETRRHEAVLADALEQLGVDIDKATPGRQVVAQPVALVDCCPQLGIIPPRHADGVAQALRKQAAFAAIGIHDGNRGAL